MISTMQFSGDCTRTLDSKNRIVLPPSFKEGLKDNSFFVICFPNNNYLRIYNEDELNSIFNETLFASGGGKKNLQRQRYVFSRMIKCELDSQNRFTISQKLIDLAGIDKEVRMIGAGTRIELWNPDLLADDFDEISEDEFDDFESDY